ncbi:glutamine amidotransferase [bacterium]|nr:glutamine amidotransferase [bacterium]
MKLTIAHLYPKLLNIYGDFGNVLTLKYRCEKRGIDVDIINIDIGDKINPEQNDIYFIGGGQDKQQIEVSKELQKQKDSLMQAANNGKVFLAICGGYQLLGKYYQPNNGEKLLGIGILDAYTIAGNKRFIGNVTAKSDFLKPKTLVGFENHAGLTYLQENTDPIAKVLVGNGNNSKDGFEGARKNNVFGTYLHGSVLPKNPHFADYLIKTALSVKYQKDIELLPLDDTIEINTHNDLINKKY